MSDTAVETSTEEAVEAAPSIVAYYVYDATGRIRGTGTCAPAEVASHAGDGQVAVQGLADGMRQYVDVATGELKTMTDAQAAARRAFPSYPARWDMATMAWVDLRTTAEMRAAQLRAIDDGFSAAATALTAGYPAAEQLTWPTQQAEALAWAANPAAPTPFLDGVAAVRGITPDDMRQRTLGAVQAFMTASQVLVGRRQQLRDLADAAPDAPTLARIGWSMPGD